MSLDSICLSCAAYRLFDGMCQTPNFKLKHVNYPVKKCKNYYSIFPSDSFSEQSENAQQEKK
jgi:hypothetical protein